MADHLRDLLEHPARFHFFTGKGGVGKTSLACATAVGLADRGRRTLLVSTDPASNLDAVLGVTLGNSPSPVPGAAHLLAMNIDPDAAARDYRERTIAPYRGTVPDAELAQIEEQLAGACTVEVAAFDEFTVLLGQDELDAVGRSRASSTPRRPATRCGCCNCRRRGVATSIRATLMCRASDRWLA